MYGCAQHSLLVPTEAVASERAACALFIHLPSLPHSRTHTLTCTQMRQVLRFAWNLLCSPGWPQTHSNLSALVSVAGIIGLSPTGLAFIFSNNQPLLILGFLHSILLFFFFFLLSSYSGDLLELSSRIFTACLCKKSLCFNL